MSELTHIDDKGRVRMVDVTEKKPSARSAVAQATVHMNAETFQRIVAGTVSKGNALETARIAGVMAAKKTHELIPFCHPLGLESCKISIDLEGSNAVIHCRCKVTHKTGLEMEALTAVQISLLTIYDMCKAVDRGMVIENVRLEEKSGGKSGHWRRGDFPDR